jgi:hypothetical protein
MLDETEIVHLMIPAFSVLDVFMLPTTKGTMFRCLLVLELEDVVIAVTQKHGKFPSPVLYTPQKL